MEALAIISEPRVFGGVRVVCPLKSIPLQRSAVALTVYHHALYLHTRPYAPSVQRIGTSPMMKSPVNSARGTHR